MKVKKRYLGTKYFIQDLNILIRFLKLKNLNIYKLSKFCVEFRSYSDNFRFSYDFHKDRTMLEHWNVLYEKTDEMRRLYITNEVCDFLFLSKGYDHRAYK